MVLIPVMNLKYKIKYHVLSISIMLIFFFGTLVSGAQPLLDQPTIKNGFRLGEMLEYSVKVRGIPAGSQTMQIKALKSIDGREVYHLASRSTVNKFFNILYAFDDRSESFILTDGFFPLKYRRNLVDGRYKGNTAMDINDKKKIANIIKDQKDYEISVPFGVQDEFSMLYFIRTKDLEVGEEYELPAVLGTKLYKVGIEVLRTEKIKTVLGEKKTIVVRSIPRNALLWITQDEERIMVKLEINTKMGKLVAELKAIS